MDSFPLLSELQIGMCHIVEIGHGKPLWMISLIHPGSLTVCHSPLQVWQLRVHAASTSIVNSRLLIHIPLRAERTSNWYRRGVASCSHLLLSVAYKIQDAPILWGDAEK